MFVSKPNYRSTIASVLAATLLSGGCLGQTSDVFGGLAELGRQRAVKKAQDEIIRRIGESFGMGAPIVLNQRNAFRVATGPADFQPRPLHLRTFADLRRPLPPGDYSVAVTGYCTQHSMHAPGIGIPYKLAPLEGKQAAAVGTLLLRLTDARSSSSEIQGMVWRLEAGVPVSQMSPEQRAIIHKFVPEYERGLDVDTFQAIENTYDKFRLLPNLPPLESLLARSEAGRAVLAIRRARQLLSDQTVSAEHLPERLFEIAGDGTPWRLGPSSAPVASPWSDIRPGVKARFTVQQGFSATNLLEFRIAEPATRPTVALRMSRTFGVSSFLPQSSAVIADGSASFTSLAEILGVALADAGATLAEAAVATNPYVLGVAAGGLLIAYSIGQSAQPLTILPKIEGGSGNDNDFPPVPPLPRAADTPARTVSSNKSGSNSISTPATPPPFGESPDDKDGKKQKRHDNEVSSIVDKAKDTHGNQGITASTREAAEKAANEFVGSDSRPIYDRSTGQVVGKISADGTRIVRYTSVNKPDPYINLENTTTRGNLHVRWGK